MPKYERDKLIRHSQSALDCLFEIGHMEQLTLEDLKDLGKVYDLLEGVVVKINTLVSGIEERKKEERRVHPIERKYNGPAFTWAKHEERADLKREIRKAQEELSRIEEKIG